MQWKKLPALYPLIGPKEKIVFDNDQELLDYLKKELGEFKLYKTTDKQIYLSTDKNVNKGFEYTTDRKWFNV